MEQNSRTIKIRFEIIYKYILRKPTQRIKDLILDGYDFYDKEYIKYNLNYNFSDKAYPKQWIIKYQYIMDLLIPDVNILSNIKNISYIKRCGKFANKNSKSILLNVFSYNLIMNSISLISCTNTCKIYDNMQHFLIILQNLMRDKTI
jgi:hypothetical protein